MTEPRFRFAGNCRTCHIPMVSRPHAAPAALCPEGRRYHACRSLCTSCAATARRTGDLIDHPRRTVRRDDLLDDWALLRDEGLSYGDFAARIGSTETAVLRALARARADGDPRALHSIPALHHMGVPA